jgi:hypothetical protein
MRVIDNLIDTTDNLADWLIDIGERHRRFRRVWLWPKLGLFPYLHLAVVFLIWILFDLAGTLLSTGSTEFIVKLVLAVFWLFVPLIEVSEYNDIVRENAIHLSFPLYFIVTLFSILHFNYVGEVSVNVVSALFLFNMLYLGLLSRDLENTVS